MQYHCKNCLKKYRQTHKAEIFECNRNHRQTHKIERYEHQKKRRKTIVGHLCHCFHQMKYRCANSKCECYKWYGGRGIKCLFKTSQEFIDYVINELKIDPRGLTIDRIDNGGNYEKGNIRFVTQAENNKNRERRYGK